MKRNTIFLVMLLLIVSFGVGGCTIAKLSGRGVAPIMMNNPHAKVEVIKHIEESKMIVFDYTGAFDASQILSKQFEESKADAIINVTFTLKTDFGTFFVNLITLGIANAKTMVIEGDLVKAPQGLGYLSIPGSEVVAEAEQLENLKLKLADGMLTSGVATMITRTASGYALVHYDQSQFQLY